MTEWVKGDTISARMRMKGLQQRPLPDRGDERGTSPPGEVL